MSKANINNRLREKVLARDNYTCRYCGSQEEPFHLDHVYPESKGGETTINNLVTACRKCNLQKHDSVGLWPMPLDVIEKSNALVSTERAMIAKEKNKREKAEEKARQLAENEQQSAQQIQDLSRRINKPVPMIWYWFVMAGIFAYAPMLLHFNVHKIASELLFFGTLSIVIGLAILITWERKR